MDMSAAALPPNQPRINEVDRKHPLFPLYRQHREFCTRQMIQASAFGDWLYQYETERVNNAAAKHERYPEFLAWMHTNQGGARKSPVGHFPHNFQFWLNGGRW